MSNHHNHRNERLFIFHPITDSEKNLIENIYDLIDPNQFKTSGDHTIAWLEHTKCVWVFSSDGGLLKQLVLDYPYHKEASLKQVKEIAISLMLGEGTYY